MPLPWTRALRRLFRPTRPARRPRASFPPRLLLLEDRLAPATLTVTTTKDDLTPNDGSVSLREAITAINAGSNLGDPDVVNTGAAFGTNDTIRFAIPGTGAQQINLTSALPALTKKVLLDGLSQGGAGNTTPLVVLNGSGAGTGANGLDLEAGSDGSTVQGFVVQGFGGASIVLNGTSNNTVASNSVGTDAGGTARVGNGVGVLIEGGARSNTVGGVTPFGAASGPGNVISGNGFGVVVTGAGTSSNRIEDNLIGTDKGGNAALGNTNIGVVVQGGATANGVGGATSGTDNVIVGSIEGVLIAGSGTSNNVVTNNEIGTNRQGTAALGNVVGVAVGVGASNNLVGAAGIVPQPGGNLIFGNTYGVVLTDGGTTGNRVANNQIGAAGLGNAVGVLIAGGATANTVGGQVLIFTIDQGRPANTITGNGLGVVLAGASTSQNLVEGNYVGTDPSGTAGLGNTYVGVLLEGGANANTVGGVAPTGYTIANAISGNGYGVVLSDAGTSKNLVAGNFIGTANNTLQLAGSSPARLGNIVGVVIENGASGNSVGGQAAGAGNAIVFSAGQGVVIVGGGTTGDSVIGNSIYGNSGLGIDLGGDGPTADGANPRTFPNGGQNFPTVTLSGGNSASGTLTSTPNTTFLVQIFSSPAGSSFQGQTLIGSATVTTDADGNASFSVSVAAVAVGDVVSATATDLSTGDTSEFSS